MPRYYSVGRSQRDCLSRESGAWDRNLHTLQPVRDSAITSVPFANERPNYWAYYCNSGPNASVGLAFSEELLSWTKYDGNPILDGDAQRDFRWPSPCLLDDRLCLFLTDTATGSLERWGSTDGISFEKVETIATGTTYFNPFVWQDPTNERWYLYTHEGEGATSTIKCRSASNPAGFAESETTTVLENDFGWHTVAAPAMMHSDGQYWLVVEYKKPAPRVFHKLNEYPAIRRMLDPIGVGGIWKTAAFVADEPTGPFTMTDDSPVLTSNAACAVHLPGPDGNLYLYYNDRRPQWHQHAAKLEPIEK